MADTPPKLNPFCDKDCDNLDSVLARAAINRQLAKDCIDCGLPFQPFDDILKEQERVAGNLKKKFFPQRP